MTPQATRFSRAVLALCVVLLWPLAAKCGEPLAAPQATATVDEAQSELVRIAQERSRVEAERRVALADCANRVLMNRCSAAVESAYRQTTERLRERERRAREIVREDRNQHRAEAAADRQRRAAGLATDQARREQDARERQRARDASREERVRELPAREVRAEQNAARHEARRQARAERDQKAAATVPKPDSPITPATPSVPAAPPSP